MEFEEEETVIEMPCHHLFHANCILPWLSKVLTYPFPAPTPVPEQLFVVIVMDWGEIKGESQDQERAGISLLIFLDKFLPSVPP